jgi:Alfin
MDSAAYNPRTPEEVFKDFRARRAGIIKALTTGIIIFFSSDSFLLHPDF